MGLEEQLLMGRMGSDVGQSMLQMLQARQLQPKYCMTVCTASFWALAFDLLLLLDAAGRPSSAD